MRKWIGSWIKVNLNQLYHWVLPFHCVLCKHPTKRSMDLCFSCQQELPIITHPCPVCAKPLPHPQKHCQDCWTHPLPFESVHALYTYEWPVMHFILNLKFQHQLIYAKLLGQLLSQTIQSNWYQHRPFPELIIPMPLHPKRLKERGFNQAVEIAKPIARTLKKPLWMTACARTKYTAAQATLTASERQQNLQDAFDIKMDLSGKHIAIVDDVITTGHTMMALCKILKQQGVKKIDVWCVARAIIRSQ